MPPKSRRERVLEALRDHGQPITARDLAQRLPYADTRGVGSILGQMAKHRPDGVRVTNTPNGPHVWAHKDTQEVEA